MDNNHVLFYKKRNQYYCEYNNNLFELNEYDMDKLKEKLALPYQLEFHSYSNYEITKITLYMYEKDMEITINKINKKNDSHIIVDFYEKKKLIDAYKVPYTCNLYGRINNNNPYTIIDVNGKKALIEVPKDFAKQNEGDYYFLEEDLTKKERKFFSPCYTLLEYDLLYRKEDCKKKENDIKKELRKLNRKNK